MTTRNIARATWAGSLLLLALACGKPGMEGNYAGECTLGMGPLPFTLRDMAHDENLVVNGGDSNWEGYVGLATLEGLDEANREGRAEGAYCVAEAGCTDPVTGDKDQGTLILSVIRSFDYAAVMIIEGKEDDDGRWDGQCWLLEPPTRNVADYGTFEMSAK